jgi:hypothetical protein
VTRLKHQVKTPYGQECRFYYEDYFRGHSKQECRLIERNPDSERWQPTLCRDCPVPAILRDNACPNMALEGKIGRGFLGLTRRVQVYAVCTLSATEVQEPHVGCGQCHPHRPSAAIFDSQEK